MALVACAPRFRAVGPGGPSCPCPGPRSSASADQSLCSRRRFAAERSNIQASAFTAGAAALCARRRRLSLRIARAAKRKGRQSETREAAEGVGAVQNKDVVDRDNAEEEEDEDEDDLAPPSEEMSWQEFKPGSAWGDEAAGASGGGRGRGGLERPALYMVATPIGNLGDITLRALEVLRGADVLYAEDTRTTRLLLSLLGVQLEGRSVLSCHAFNEPQAAESIISQLREGRSVALVSDAGTPLVSDPGFAVLRRVREEFGSEVPVRPVPGPCAAIAALSVAGVAATRYLFAGFLPSKKSAKRVQLKLLLQQARQGDPATLILYEAPHRILSTLRMVAEALDDEGSSLERRVAVCRELTKRYETTLFGQARDVLAEVEGNPDQQRGEFVVLVEGGDAKSAEEEKAVKAGTLDAKEVMRLLGAELPKGRAAALAAKICGVSKKELFEAAVAADDYGR